MAKPVCYFYSPTQDALNTAAHGEGRYIHGDQGDPTPYTNCLPLFEPKWQTQIKVGSPLTPELAAALKPYGIAADSIPVCVSDQPRKWGLIITDRQNFDTRPEHECMSFEVEGLLPVRDAATNTVLLRLQHDLQRPKAA